MDDDVLVERDSGPDQAYRWTVRLLYSFLLGAELYMINDAYLKEKPAIQSFKAKVAAKRQEMAAAMSGCEGCAKRKEWLRDKAHMFWQAEDIVTGGTGQPEEETAE